MQGGHLNPALTLAAIASGTMHWVRYVCASPCKHVFMWVITSPARSGCSKLWLAIWFLWGLQAKGLSYIIAQVLGTCARQVAVEGPDCTEASGCTLHRLPLELLKWPQSKSCRSWVPLWALCWSHCSSQVRGLMTLCFCMP